MIWRISFATNAEAENIIGQYIDGFYNIKHQHITLNYQSIVLGKTGKGKE